MASVRFHVVTLFPEAFTGPLSSSILGRAVAGGLVEVRVWNLREFAAGPHRVTDDYPYGGGGGMVMKPEPVFDAVEAVRSGPGVPVILLTPHGRALRQEVVEEVAGHREMVLVCGHYEGVDERVREHLATDEISIGDYVLTGGELPALVLMDAVARLVPGVVQDRGALQDDSHTSGILQHPQYTRPRDFRGWAVPGVLLSGNHAQIARWRREQALLRTLRRRPELLSRAPLSAADRDFLSGCGHEPAQ